MNHIRAAIRGLGSLLRPVMGRFRGEHGVPIPPRRLRGRVGRGNYREVGREFFGIFTRKAGLRSGARVLDVGCGIGRMAVPLVPFLEPPGRYDGFDIDPDAIGWCTRNISSVRPHFRFRLVDVANRRYNPDGALKGSDVRFPYEDSSFDFAFAISVFTHLLAPDLQNYVSEVRRVLAPSGTFVATFFILNEEARGMTLEGKARLTFRPSDTGYSMARSDVPEAAVAYDELYVRDQWRKNDLEIMEPIHYGAWCGRMDALTFQDVVIATGGRRLRARSFV